MSLPQLRLDNQLCFLFQRICRELNAAYRPRSPTLGLTYPQYLVMLVLWERDGLGVVSLATARSRFPARCRRCCAGWSGASLVRRERAPPTSAGSRIRLTDRGRDLQEPRGQHPEAMPTRRGRTRSLRGYEAQLIEIATGSRPLAPRSPGAVTLACVKIGGAVRLILISAARA